MVEQDSKASCRCGDFAMIFVPRLYNPLLAEYPSRKMPMAIGPENPTYTQAFACPEAEELKLGSKIDYYFLAGF